MFEGREFEGQEIKGVLFDCYNTLIDIQIDEDSPITYEPLSRWLTYQGVKLAPDELLRLYKSIVKEKLDSRWEKYPEIRVEEVFSELCSKHALWPVDGIKLGIETARTFRAASLRRFSVFPQSIKLLELLNEYPMGIISNGQRVFSEIELRYLGLSKYFQFVIFSSDVGYKKPDPRIFTDGIKRLDLEPEEILCFGDSFENDIIPAVKLGMKTFHIEEAWKLFKVV